MPKRSQRIARKFLVSEQFVQTPMDWIGGLCKKKSLRQTSARNCWPQFAWQFLHAGNLRLPLKSTSLFDPPIFLQLKHRGSSAMLDWRRVYWPAMAIRIIPGIVSGDRITPIYKPWKGHLEEVPTTLKGLAITLVIKHVLTGMIQVHGSSRTGYTSKMAKERLFTNAKPPPHTKKSHTSAPP